MFKFSKILCSTSEISNSHWDVSFGVSMNNAFSLVCLEKLRFGDEFEGLVKGESIIKRVLSRIC